MYEYECANCEKVHEVLQKFSDTPLTECPDCGKSIKKLMSRSSFALKGTGWYTTDYKRASVQKAEPKSEAKSESKLETKSESKSEAKSEPKKGDA